MRSLTALLLLASSSAWAVPSQLGWQGRLLDANGDPVAGDLDLTFRLLTAPSGGDTVWQETQSVTFQEGYYAVVLGADQAANPLDDDALGQWPLFLEVQVAGRPPMFPRSELSSVPFARLAGTATNLQGGDVDAASIAVGGVPVVDAQGNWVGPAPLPAAPDRDTLAALACAEGQIPRFEAGVWTCGDDATGGAGGGSFAALPDVPPSLVDGDDDTLANLSCLDGQLPVWDAPAGAWACGLDRDTFAGFQCAVGQVLKASAQGWACGADANTAVTEAEIDAFVANNGYALAANLATVATSGRYADLTGLPAGLADGDDDTLANLSCLNNGELPVWDAVLGAWICGVDRDTFAGFRCAVGQVLKANAQGWACGADANSTVTEAEIDAFVANNGYALAANLAPVATAGTFASLTGVPTGLADGDNDTLAGLSCLNGQLPVWDSAAARWLCGVDRDTFAGFTCSVGQILKRGAGGWACGSDADTAVTEAEVDAFVANNGYALAANLAPVATAGTFASLTGVPTGLADGDNDTLAGLSCLNGQLPVWDSAAARWLCGVDRDTFAGFTCSVGQILKRGAGGWACGSDADTAVTEAEVDAFVANNGYALAANLAPVATAGTFASLTGVPTGLADGDNDTLAGLSCLNGQLPVWDSPAGAWLCGVDRDTFAGFTCSVGQILKRGANGWACGADADTAVTEAEVDAFVANNGYALAADLAPVATAGTFASLTGVPTGLADGDNDTLAGLSCLNGQLPVWDSPAGAWLCGVDRDTFAGFTCSVGQILKRGANGWACGADADTAVTEAEVDAFVANNGYLEVMDVSDVALTGSFASLVDVPTGIANGDDDTLANLQCASGESIAFVNGSWTCQPPLAYPGRVIAKGGIQYSAFGPVIFADGSSVTNSSGDTYPMNGNVIGVSADNILLEGGQALRITASNKFIAVPGSYSEVVSGVGLKDSSGKFYNSVGTILPATSAGGIQSYSGSSTNYCLVTSLGGISCSGISGAPPTGANYTKVWYYGTSTSSYQVICGLTTAGTLRCTGPMTPPAGTFVKVDMVGQATNGFMCGLTTSGNIVCHSFGPSGPSYAQTTSYPFLIGSWVDFEITGDGLLCARNADGRLYGRCM
jgi:hypothetical protein